MRQLGLNPRNGGDYPLYFFTNKVSKGLYKMPTKGALIKGTPEATAASIVKSKQPKIKATKAFVGRVNTTPTKSPKPTVARATRIAKEDSDIGTGAFDDSVSYEDVHSLRSEFGLGSMRNTID